MHPSRSSRGSGPAPLTHGRTRRERGSVLIAVVLVVLVLGGLSVALLTEGLAEQASVSQRKSNLLALQICEMGLVQASMEIHAQRDSGTDGIGTVSGEYGGGTYEVTAVQSPTQPDRWILTARGEFAYGVRRIEAGIRRRENSDFVEGLFAKDTLTFNGTTQTDAYDSRLGTWPAQAVNADGSGTYADGGGHIGSNGDIVLNGSSVTIRGNAIPGPLRATLMSGGPTVWGDVLPRRHEIQLDPATLAEFQTALATNDNAQLVPAAPGNGGNGNNGNGKPGGGGSNPYNAMAMSLIANGQEIVTLGGGTYFFSTVRLTGQSALQIDGPTVIYVTGDFDVSGGGVVNSSGRPGDLIVYAHPYALPPGHTPTSSQVKVRGGSQAAMAVYAPGAAISVAGNDDVFGAFIGETVTIAGNSKFHYDRALGDINTHSKVTLERLYWRDLDERLR